MEMLKTVCAVSFFFSFNLYFILTDKIQQVYKSKVQTRGKYSIKAMRLNCLNDIV